MASNCCLLAWLVVIMVTNVKLFILLGFTKLCYDRLALFSKTTKQHLKMCDEKAIEIWGEIKVWPIIKSDELLYWQVKVYFCVMRQKRKYYARLQNTIIYKRHSVYLVYWLLSRQSHCLPVNVNSLSFRNPSMDFLRSYNMYSPSTSVIDALHRLGLLYLKTP